MPRTERLPPPVYLFSPFSDDEWNRLERFARKLRCLEESEFPSASLNIVATPVGHPGPLGGRGWAFGVDGPAESQVKQVIGDFRQLYTDPNRTSARSILKMLDGHARTRGTDVARSLSSQLKVFGKRLGKRKKKDPRGYMLEEGHDGLRSPDSIVQDWFNGVYFHDDDSEGRSELERDGHSTVEMFRWSLHSAIRDFISDWGKLGILVDAILRDPGLRVP